MKICACSSEVVTHCPSPDCSRSSNATRMPIGAQQSGRQIGDRNADAHRPLPGQAGDRHQPAHALRDLVEARALAIRPVLAEAGNAAEDDALVDLLQALIVDAEPRLDVRPVVLDHDIGLLDHAPEGGDPARSFQVERDAALVRRRRNRLAPAWLPRPSPFSRVRRCSYLDEIAGPNGRIGARRRNPSARALDRRMRKREEMGLRRPGKRDLRCSERLETAEHPLIEAGSVHLRRHSGAPPKSA